MIIIYIYIYIYIICIIIFFLNKCILWEKYNH